MFEDSTFWDAGGVIASIVVAVVTYWWGRKSVESLQAATIDGLRHNLTNVQQQLDNEQRQTTELQNKAEENEATIQSLEGIKDEYFELRKWAEQLVFVTVYRLPVLLVGRRGTGKTSLIDQWHAPWDKSDPSASTEERYRDVTVHYFDPSTLPEHPYFKEINANSKTHLMLRVHDFPGEMDVQSDILRRIKEESARLRRTLRANLGLALVIMLDASEADAGISDETRSYFNGDLSRDIQGLVASSSAYIDRIAIIYNKMDELRARRPDLDTDKLIALCNKKLSPLVTGIKAAVNPEKIIEIPAVLGGPRYFSDGRGASIIKGEIARRFVATIGGDEVANSVAPAYNPEHGVVGLRRDV